MKEKHTVRISKKDAQESLRLLDALLEDGFVARKRDHLRLSQALLVLKQYLSQDQPSPE